MEVLLAVGGALGASGLGGWWWSQRARRRHVRQVRTAWVRAGQTVQHEPVGAVCLGLRPQRRYGRGTFGAVGITDDRLTFDGHRDNSANLSVHFERLRRIGLTTVATFTGQTQALTAHYDSPDGWRVATLVTDSPLELAQALSAESGLPVRDSGDQRDDFGPADAIRMTQDVYGEWAEDRPGTLYLAPDRLLFNWRDAIPLAQIERVDALQQSGARRPDLLRVEFATPDDATYATDAVGFVVTRAFEWAAAIQQRADNPVEVHAGRKKKLD